MSKPIKYRKLPVVIEAIRHEDNGEEIVDILAWVNAGPLHPSVHAVWNGELQIHTTEGKMHAEFDDYIIKGVKGEFYPCKPDIFEATYERVEEPSTETE